MAQVEQGSIVLRRIPSLGRDMFRAYKIYVDREVVGEVRRGGEQRIALPPGEHLVHIKIDWCTSPGVRVEVAAGSEVRLLCGPNRSGAGAFRDATTNRANYVWLRPES